MQHISERELQATIITACELTGRLVFHLEDARRRVRRHGDHLMVGDAQTAGYPDLTIARQGEILWAELKGARGRLETRQVEWLDQLPPHQAYVWQPEHLDHALEIIQRGHPAEAGTCWACHRAEILKRCGVRRQNRGRIT